MSPNYLSPGVYVEEVDKGMKPIEAVGTAVAAFVGYTEKASDVRDGEVVSLLGKPTLVTNWSQFVAKFGSFVSGAYLPDAVYGYFNNGGSTCYIVSIKTLGAADDPELATPAKAIVSGADGKSANLLEFTAKQGGPSGNGLRVEVKVPEGKSEDGKELAPTDFTLVVTLNGQVMETFDGLTTGKGENNVETVVKTRSKLIDVKVTGKGEIIPAAGTYQLEGGEIKTKSITLKDYQGSVAERRGIGGLEPLDDVTMICVPDLMSSYQAGEIDMKGVQAVQQAVID